MGFNLRKLQLFTCIPMLSFAAIDTGTGADGACIWSGTANNATYNCTTLTVTAATQLGAATAVHIKVQGDVLISANLTANGVGSAAVAGGYAGAACNSGADASAPASALNAAGRSGGTATNAIGAFSVGGGGGEGGSHASLGASGATGGDPNGDETPGPGGNNASSVTYGSELNFQTTMLGGAGGGGGTVGDTAAAATTCGGGAGGGSLRISAGGSVTIDSTFRIQANGADGGAGNDAAGASSNGGTGGGGGGAGGSIFIEAIGDISIIGNIDANGGAGGTGGAGDAGAGNGGVGGAGGNGRIRLDSEGIVSGTSNVSPTPIVFSNGTAPEFFTGEITPGCVVLKTKSEASASLITLLISFIGLNILLKRQWKIKKAHA